MKKIIISVVTSALLLTTATLQAKIDKQTLVRNEMANAAKNHKVAPKEIILGMQNTYKALQDLRAQKKEDAKKDLQTALDNFNKALKDNPNLDIVPIDERFQAFAFLGSTDDIKKALNLGQKLLKEHNTQLAIDTISPLKDELDITIPMKIYPKAVQKALETLKKGDTKKAYTEVAEVMNSLVLYKTVIPTPLLIAQDFVLEASKLDKTKKDDATKLLEAAKYALSRAELLGYTKLFPNEYANLTKSINGIEKEIKGKNEVEKLYDKLKDDFKSLLSKTRASKVKLENHIKAEEKVNNYEKKEQQEAIKKASEFHKEATKDVKK